MCIVAYTSIHAVVGCIWLYVHTVVVKLLHMHSVNEVRILISFQDSGTPCMYSITHGYM